MESKTENKITAKVYAQNGKETGSIELPEKVFGVAWNADMVHQTITSITSSARTPVAHVKTRGEVRGGGKKPWKQKGLGRARHGSIRSPIWVGGGVTHGPRNDKNYDRKVSKKMKAKALCAILTKKWNDGQILFVESIEMKDVKTKEAKAIFNTISKIKGFEKMAGKKTNAAYIALSEKNEKVEKGFRNMGNVSVNEVRNINPVDILNYKYLVISNPAESIKTMESRATF